MANDVKYIIGLCRQDCATIDPIDLGYWSEWLDADFAVTPVDVYGGLGFVSGKYLGKDHPKFCDLYCYCDGPTDDGVTPAWQWDRYVTRWIAVFESGEMFYGKVGDVLIPAPAELFPDTPFEGVVKISMAFDMNARPVFCMEYENGLIEVRRFEAGEFRKYSFNGTSPVLIQNGILQYNLDQRDVVCYYIEGTSIKARFQRDNFADEYEIVTGLTNYTLEVTDRGRGVLGNTHILETESRAGDQTLFYVNYPPWPIVEVEPVDCACEISSDVSHELVVVVTDGSDSASSDVSIGNDILYFPQTETTSGQDSASAFFTIGSDIDYQLTTIVDGPYTDSASASQTIGSDIHYAESVVPMSESEPMGSNVLINSDIDYSL